MAAAAPPPSRDRDGIDLRFLELPETSGGALGRIAREYDDAAAGRAFARVLDELKPDVVHFYHLSGLTVAALGATVERAVPAVLSFTDFWFECPTVQLLLPDGSTCEGPRADRSNCVRHLLANRLPDLAIGRFRVGDAAATAITQASRMLRRGRVERAWTDLRERSPRIRHMIEAAALVVAPTELVRSRLEGFGVAPGKLRLLRYGVPPPRGDGALRYAEGVDAGKACLRVTFAGSLNPSKGAHLLLRALATLPGLDAEMRVFGKRVDATYAHWLDRLAGTDERVRFEGTFADGEFEAILARTDVLVIPSLWYENAPLVLLQALANRCPVLVADVPGLVEALRVGVDGWTFKRGDADDLAARLRWIADNREQLAVVRAAEYATRTFVDYMNDLMPIYEALTSKGRPSL